MNERREMVISTQLFKLIMNLFTYILFVPCVTHFHLAQSYSASSLWVEGITEKEKLPSSCQIS